MQHLASYAAYRILASRISSSFNSSVAPSGTPETGGASEPAETVHSLYLHIPFCRSRCTFCNFYSEADGGERIGPYMEALGRELSWYAGRGLSVRQLFIGGGTPAVAGEPLFSLMQRISALWPDALVSVELAPRDLLPQTAERLLGAGCSRVSIGVQSFGSAVLNASGRDNGDLSLLRERIGEWAGLFPEVNVDMMYGFAGQKREDIGYDAALIRELRPHQISWYPLIGGKALNPEEFGRFRLLHRAVREELGERYRPVSAWSFALQEHERLAEGEYLASGGGFAGLGASAFGFAGSSFSVNRFTIGGYLAADRARTLDSAGPPVMYRRTFSHPMLKKYRLLMDLFALRTQGLAASRADLFLARCAGIRLDAGGRAEFGEEGEFMISLGMRELFRGVDRLRENMLECEA